MAKKLKEAGWSAGYTDHFLWVHQAGEDFLRSSSNMALVASSDMTFFPAPTAEEILRKLPISDYKIIPHNKWQPEYESDKGFCIEWRQDEKTTVRFHGTLSDACARMYIFLSQNNLLPKDE